MYKKSHLHINKSQQSDTLTLQYLLTKEEFMVYYLLFMVYCLKLPFKLKFNFKSEVVRCFWFKFIFSLKFIECYNMYFIIKLQILITA